MAEGNASSRAGRGMQTFLKNLVKLSLVEKVVGAIALLVLVGWVAQGSEFTTGTRGFLRSWFTTCSSLGSLGIATVIVLKLFEIRPLSERLERHAIALLALIPLVGLVIDSLTPITQFLTIGGSLALAYISATSFWRKHLPTIPAERGEPSRPESKLAGPGAPPPPPPASTPPVPTTDDPGE